MLEPSRWQGQHTIQPKSWTCGFCNAYVGGMLGFAYVVGGVSKSHVYICPRCGQPTYFDGDKQVPGVAFGRSVDHLPSDVGSLYQESRNCMSVNAYTAAVLACRKLLMNIAVAKGAQAGRPFIFYVDFLADNGFIPPGGKGWVDHIRANGNEATHEIQLMPRLEAEQLMSFVEMLLTFVFEFPARIG